MAAEEAVRVSVQELLYASGRYEVYEGGLPVDPVIPTVPEANRDGLDSLWGTYEPSYETTGLWPGYTYNTTTGATNLPNYHAGNWTITEAVAATLPNRTISGYKIDGKLSIRAANVTVVNCWVRGLASPGLSNQNLIDTNFAEAVNFIIKDSVLIPQTPTYGWNMVGTHDYTAIRCYGKWTVDFFRINRSSGTAGVPYNGPVNVKILACFAEEGSYFSPDPNHTNDNRVHSDWVQIEGGSQIQIIGNKMVGKHAGWQSNYIPSLAVPGAQTAPSPLWPGAVYGVSGTDEGSVAWNIFAPGNPQPPSVPGGYGRFGWSLMTSLIQITQNTGQVSGMLVDRNWAYAAATMFNASNGGTYPPPVDKSTNLGTWSNNRFHRSAGQPGHAIAYGVNFTLTTFGNVYMDDGTPAQVKTQTS